MPAFYRNPLIDKVGIWGIPTSTLDWCEENYAVTKYVAEFCSELFTTSNCLLHDPFIPLWQLSRLSLLIVKWNVAQLVEDIPFETLVSYWNTITNYFMVVPPLLAAVRCHQLGVDTRFILCFLSLMGIGIGSTLFHATLLYKMQLLDELPMIYCTYIMLYCVLACDTVPRKRDFVLKLVLTVFSILVTVVYIVLVDPLVFQWVYGLSVAVLIISTNYSARKHKVSYSLSILAVVCYGIGFILWNIDNAFCTHVRYLRDILPWPFDTLGQLHGWWHCLAAFGGYFQILYMFDLRATCVRNKEKCAQNGAVHQNGVLHKHSLEKRTISSSGFRDLWCWIPRKKLHDPEYGINNNIVYGNGTCKTRERNSY